MPDDAGFRPCEEISAVADRFYRFFRDGDVDSLRELISADPRSVFMGTDRFEWWTSRDEMIEIARIQTEEFGSSNVVPHKRTAAQRGDVGWGADELILHTPGGEEIPLRCTFVVTLERGHWRTVHFHISAPSDHESMLGVVLTTSVDGLARVVGAERPDLTDAVGAGGTVTIVFTDIGAPTEMAE